jgi:hypothetical protein
MPLKDIVATAFEKDGVNVKSTIIHTELEKLRAVLREAVSFEYSPKTEGLVI